VTAWRASRPHEAWTILADAGMRELWPHFQRIMLRRARDHYRSRMPQ